MGPQKFICGNRSGMYPSGGESPSFNGAAEIHLRKYAELLRGRAGDVASMGPQKFICGNSDVTMRDGA